MAALREADYARQTYRHLRMILVALALLLFVGTLCGLIFYGTVTTSISANYGGPLHNIFVGAMVGIGACLIAFRGRPLEDHALNLGGFYALFVAVVPSTLTGDLAAISDEQLHRDAMNSVRVATIAILVVSGLFVLVERRIGADPGSRLQHAPAGAKVAYWVLWAVAFLFVALVLFRIAEGKDFAWIHPSAALGLVASMAVAVACNGWPKAAGVDDLPANRRYKVIAIAMFPGVGVVALLAWWLIPDYLVDALEWWSVGLFAAFWTMETVRTWDAAIPPVAAGAVAAPAAEPGADAAAQPV